MKQKVVTVGLDLAKSIFQVHAIGSDVTPSFPPAGIRAGRLFCA